MAGQMPPDNEHGLTSWGQHNDRTEHPADDLLLAYVNRQQLNNWMAIHKHVLQCRVCQQKCLVYEQMGMMITSGIHEHQAAQAYPSLANSVLERIEREDAQSWGNRVAGLARVAYTSSPLKSVVERTMGTGRGEKTMPFSPVPGTQFKQPGAFISKQTSNPIPAVRMPGRRVPRVRTGMSLANNAALLLVVLLATFSIAIAALATVPNLRNLTRLYAPPTTVKLPAHLSVQPTQGITPVVSSTGTTGPAYTITPTPVQTPKSESTPTSIPVVTATQGSGSGQGAGTPTIQLCSTQNDIRKWIVRICGSGFNPGDHILLYIHTSSYSRTVSQSADAQGNLHYSFTIGSNCKYVPNAIFVMDVTHFGRWLVLQNIAFGSCPVPTTQTHPH